MYKKQWLIVNDDNFYLLNSQMLYIFFINLHKWLSEERCIISIFVCEGSAALED